MASSSRIPQSKETLLKTYKNQLKVDVRNMLVNFEEIMKLASRESPNQICKATQCEQDALEMQVRAANMVRAGESLIKLVHDIKEFHILYDFPAIDEDIKKKSELCSAMQAEYDDKIARVAKDMADELSDLEDEYNSSSHT
ncbi:mediator of RNA polymerase II transcription subunit 22 [Drosophila rhopaloa]|uniref:Mediator of RNA polymerase II transcription subunit 22 n=1 Tax=Drosophila rhopaloa TaxID=1041015 RepID=A0A6P4FMQ2_DRORH|nr:mediator of RNA polymerase II transcription subunit 22 [Drosophila rhopaloa]XP_044316340.1 mediator of RNA polymerase II transcription subunit 22 [Drosophila rhopaloa]